MMNKSKIDWCDFSWNPITGCHHECTYCYARKQARRFCGDVRINKGSDQLEHDREAKLWTLKEPFKSEAGKTIPFPAGFEPTLHEYRLSMPALKKKPANIFVCSMADLFGEWVPDEWIKRVFEACRAAPWHNYLFLTKNPNRYCKMANASTLPKDRNFWYGTTITKAGDTFFGGRITDNIFLSIEPLQGSLNAGIGSFGGAKWIIVGAETGNAANKITPEREWIENIIEAAKLTQASVLLKDSTEMKRIWGEEIIQELPAELQRPEDIPVPHCSECEHLKTTERHYDPSKSVTAMNHFCTAGIAYRRIGGRYARTSPPWCPKRTKGGEK